MPTDYDETKPLCYVPIKEEPSGNKPRRKARIKIITECLKAQLEEEKSIRRLLDATHRTIERLTKELVDLMEDENG